MKIKITDTGRTSNSNMIQSKQCKNHVNKKRHSDFIGTLEMSIQMLILLIVLVTCLATTMCWYTYVSKVTSLNEF